MKENGEIFNETLVEIMKTIVKEDPEMCKQIVKAIPDSADYFRQRWEENFGTLVDVSSFTDEEIIDATLAIHQIKVSEIRKEDFLREVAKILRIKLHSLH